MLNWRTKFLKFSYICPANADSGSRVIVTISAELDRFGVGCSNYDGKHWQTSNVLDGITLQGWSLSKVLVRHFAVSSNSIQFTAHNSFFVPSRAAVKHERAGEGIHGMEIFIMEFSACILCFCTP